MNPYLESNARISTCGTYRYLLSRVWGDAPPAVFIMLNPSTADAVKNDPTIDRCERRGRKMGHGGLIVANLFALRSADPAKLFRHPDPVGPGNDAAILEAVANAGIVICAWGRAGKWQGRDAAVLALLRGAGVEPRALSFNKNGTPRHPLYVSYDKTPEAWP
ncbi:MAG: DUF1643 domain-containing protein [Candidatus Accumulibacter sp.]|jgi:hypothetical protein|nr:DUF1643 domain-containing protein [Accumulibacter sp.]